MRKVIIEYLYLDLNTCERCVGTDEVLNEVLDVLKPALQLAGYEVVQQKTEMETKELATQYRFLSSPTILVNGKDICLSVEENDCGCCSDICGTDVECRVFRYGDETYEIPPKEMLANAILQTLFSDRTDDIYSEYVMPGNLKLFYQNKNLNGESTMKKVFIYEPALCCETGVCGVSVDPELLRISTVANNLKKNGVAIQRYNLKSFPQEFINNKEINKLIMDDGVDSLPATVVDGKIVKTRAYPTNEEIAALLDIPINWLREDSGKSDDCCCEGGCC